MKLNSDFVLELLNFFFWIYTIILCIALSVLVLLIGSNILGLNIGNMKEMKVYINFAGEKIPDIQSLEKGKMLLILVYNLTCGILELILFINVIKIIKKLKLNHFFSSEIYFRISKIAKLALAIGCISLMVSFFRQLIDGTFSLSLDINNENFQFFLFAGIVYIIAQVYKRAVDLQSENDLTI